MTQSQNLGRDMAIVRRYREGEKAPLLAAVFRVNVSRVYQLNRSFGDLPSKPHIKTFAGGLWACVSQDAEGMGDSPVEAYEAWLKLLSAFLRRITAAPRQDPSPPTTTVAAGAIVTVGRSARLRPLTISPAMQINAARAMEAQPKLASLSGSQKYAGAKLNV